MLRSSVPTSCKYYRPASLALQWGPMAALLLKPWYGDFSLFPDHKEINGPEVILLIIISTPLPICLLDRPVFTLHCYSLALIPNGFVGSVVQIFTYNSLLHFQTHWWLYARFTLSPVEYSYVILSRSIIQRTTWTINSLIQQYQDYWLVK